MASDGVWYYGEVVRGRRVIEVLGFCASLVEHADRCAPMVQDGGDCIWSFEWDVERGTFASFRTNGYA